MGDAKFVYCGQCGQANPGGNKFCGECGAKLQQASTAAMALEYEYKTLAVSAELGNDFGRVYARTGIAWDQISALTEHDARIHFWQVDQAKIHALLEREAAHGWQPYTEVGPGCIKIRNSLAQQSGGGIFGNVLGRFLVPEWCYIGFEVGLRRAIRSLS